VNLMDDDEREDGYEDGAHYGGAVQRAPSRPQTFGTQSRPRAPGQFGRR